MTFSGSKAATDGVIRYEFLNKTNSAEDTALLRVFDHVQERRYLLEFKNRG